MSRPTRAEIRRLKKAGERVRKAREGAEPPFTLAELALNIGCSISKLSNIERGITKPTIEEIAYLRNLDSSIDARDWYPNLERALDIDRVPF